MLFFSCWNKSKKMSFWMLSCLVFLHKLFCFFLNHLSSWDILSKNDHREEGRYWWYIPVGRNWFMFSFYELNYSKLESNLWLLKRFAHSFKTAGSYLEIQRSYILKLKWLSPKISFQYKEEKEINPSQSQALCQKLYNWCQECLQYVYLLCSILF